MKEYIILCRSNGTTRNNSPYIQLKVTDGEQTMNISVWDVPSHEGPEVGQLVQFFNLKDYMGKKSCGRMEMLEGVMADAGHPLYNQIPRPITHEVWERTIQQLLTFCNDDKLAAIICEFADKLYAPYSRYPAATSVHHAYPGGLLNHTHQMLHMLQGLYPCLPYPIKAERCVLAILFHDYGKLFEYNAQGETQPDMYLLGHIYIGAHKLQNELEKRGIDSEETKRIIHCILSHHGLREYGSPVLPCIQEASIVSYLDNISAKTDTIEGAGEMEYVNALGTHVVKG